MLRTLALIALAPALAFAKTTVVTRDAGAGDSKPEDNRRENVARIIIGEAGLDIAMDRLRVVTTNRELTSTVRLVFTVSTKQTERRHAVMPLALPTGARIVGAAVAIGNEPHIVASTLAPDAARTEYQNVYWTAKDPLLVEMVDPDRDLLAIWNDAIEPRAAAQNAFFPVPPQATESAGFVNYVVRAFPIIDRDRARIELTIELPGDATRLVIAHAQQIGSVEFAYNERTIRRHRDVHAPISVPLPAMERMPVGVATVALRSHVDATHSLYAGWTPRGPAAIPTVTIGMPQGPTHGSSVDGREIRRKVKLHRAQLARCYTAVTEFGGGPEGTLVMHFLINTDGRVLHATVDGEIDDPRITDCLAERVREWEFRKGTDVVMVNYPLHFQMAR